MLPVPNSNSLETYQFNENQQSMKDNNMLYNTFIDYIITILCHIYTSTTSTCLHDEYFVFYFYPI